MNPLPRRISTAQPSSAFRSDINGLRALAICLVVAFHAFPSALPGGFVGVDVFFVVSGYLISRIVLRGLQAESFNFLDFYGRRAVRILPALLLVLAVTCAFGWITLYSFEFASLGRHTVAAVGFVLNFVLWNESGYFDASALQKPLMHLWSLAVEEQFYLFFPLLIWAAHRLHWNLRKVILGFLILSFVLNVAASSVDLVGDFFNPATRVWEILVGSLIAAHQAGQFGCAVAGPTSRAATLPRHLDILSVAGLLAILGSAIAFNDTLRFPGWYALVPTIGTGVLVVAGQSSLVGRLLSNRAVAWLGLVSYPLYLWHWPILSFAAILHPSGSHRVVTALAMTGALALALLTYVVVERPVAAMESRRLRGWIIALPAIATAFFGITADSAAGFPDRMVSVEAPVDHEQGAVASLPPGNVQQGCDVPVAMEAIYAHCQHDSRALPRFALLGDSKAASLAPGLFSNDDGSGRWLFIGGYMRNGSTPVPVLSDAPEFQSHQASLRPALAAISADTAVRVVVLATATRSLFKFPEADSIAALADSKEYPTALDGLDRSVATLLKTGKKVVLLVDNPTFRAPLLCVSRTTSLSWIDGLLNLKAGLSSCEISRSDQLKASAKYRALLQAVVARHPNRVFIFDSLDVLCDPATSICSAMDGSHHLYSYSDHISVFAAHKIAQKLIPFIEAIARQ